MTGIQSKTIYINDQDGNTIVVNVSSNVEVPGNEAELLEMLAHQNPLLTKAIAVDVMRNEIAHEFRRRRIDSEPAEEAVAVVTSNDNVAPYHDRENRMSAGHEELKEDAVRNTVDMSLDEFLARLNTDDENDDSGNKLETYMSNAIGLTDETVEEGIQMHPFQLNSIGVQRVRFIDAKLKNTSGFGLSASGTISCERDVSKTSLPQWLAASLTGGSSHSPVVNVVAHALGEYLKHLSEKPT